MAPARPTAPAAAPAPPPAPLIAPEALIALHQAVRVPGLERRDFDHATYWRVMQPFLGGSVSWKVEGQSAEGREIRHLTFGSGPTKVLLWSQMHGNESTASMALVDIVRFFHEQPDHPLSKRIASGMTVHLIPMLNPDGAERFRRRNAQGIDVNRDARRLQTPEGKLLKRVSDELKPDFGFNLHDQGPGTRVGRTSRGAAIALLAPAFNEARDVDAKRERAMRIASVLATSMRPLVTDHITKYDDAFNPRAFGDLMGAWGASTVLIESGGWADDPQKQHLRKTNFVGILSALDAIATGTYAQYDPAIYDTLEPNGRSMPDLLVVNGTLAIPGIPTLTVDFLISYGLPLEKAEGTITDIGDLGDVQAQDTLDLTGLYIIPLPEALDGKGGIDAGAPARFIVAEDAQGTKVRFRFEGGPARREE
ncbi:MAG TPA: M14 family zinc carboxypeptidase [Longimicrobiales bacterium]|nr:M14 family zinc carboxypeptidase [Longimicrobiales bacterium]